jgi:hypothetical protein
MRVRENALGGGQPTRETSKKWVGPPSSVTPTGGPNGGAQREQRQTERWGPTRGSHFVRP